LTEHLILSLAVVIILGISAQWLAWLLRVPSILVLLLFGLLAGPVAGFINPDAMLGDVLFPAVSLSVAVILFEGGLSLRILELKQIGGVVRNLVTLGALVTWFLGAVSARYLLGLPLELAVLFGAILIVTGPTVIGPMLRYLRPTGPVGPILKWESILIDPIGATVSVLVFEAIRSGVFEEITSLALIGVMKTLLLGGLVGGAGAGFMVLLLMKYWVPDYLQNPLSLMMVISVYAVSNLFQAESGLLAVTVMGVLLANQKVVSVRHIVEFKENIRVLLISTLFILLAARLTRNDLDYLNVLSLTFLGTLLVVVRPAAAWLSTLGSDLGWRERFFIGAVAPRGIVAAAVSSIFSIRLVEGGNAPAEALIPLTFLVIIGTVVVYGLSAPAIAYRFKLARPKPQGALIIGAHHWAQEIAKVVQSEGHRVILVDNSWRDISRARMAGLPAFFANVLSEYALEQIDMGGLGRLLALTPNDEINSLAVLHFSHLFGRAEVYQLASDEEPKERREEISAHLRGRLLFGKEMNYTFLSQQFNKGMVVKKTPLTKEFDYDAFRGLYGEEAIILFIKNPSGEIIPFTADRPPSPKPGQTLISLVDPKKESPSAENPAEGA
jgi:NhaP-type Na+/H+ or K+/H+ antiporter